MEKVYQKSYFVVPPEPKTRRANVDMRWFYEGRPKDVPEPFPLPGGYSEKFLHGLQTQSGKFEFVPSSLSRLQPPRPDRPPLLNYVRPFGWMAKNEGAEHYPIQLMTTHQRFSFHTAQDGKGGALNNIEDHRILIDGRHYWLIRISIEDARQRGLTHHQLVRVFNKQASVICAVEVTNRMAVGIAHSYESSARYETVKDGQHEHEIGGCMNVLTPNRMQADGTVASAASLCLVEIEAWQAARNADEVKS